MYRPVKYAKLHGGDAFIPGIGGLGSTLPPLNKTLAGFKMFYTENGLVLQVSGQEGIIPLANVQLAVFSGPEVADVSKAS